jgi:hypothetical protein
MQKKLESRRMLQVKIPDTLYFELKQTSMFTQRTMADIVAAGVRYVLKKTQLGNSWPREYYKSPQDYADSSQPVDKATVDLPLVKSTRVVSGPPKHQSFHEQSDAEGHYTRSPDGGPNGGSEGTTQPVTSRTRANTLPHDE